MTGRETELQYLESYYNMEQSNFIVMYGQQGVGKTTLLKNFMQGKDSFYYLSSHCSAKEQQFLFARCCEAKNDDLPSYATYEECYTYLCKNRKEQTGRKKVIVIDEFVPCLKHYDAFVQELVQLMQRENVMLILCSSMTSFIENDFAMKIGMLALQISGFLKIRQLRYHVLRDLYPKFKEADAMKMYAVLGGVPVYWNLFDEHLSFEENMKKKILSAHTYLSVEAERIVGSELRETSVYNTILMKLASGICKLNDIHECTSFSRAKISVYLKNLMELEIVEKIFSYDTNGKENTQKGIYRIQNHFLAFWYRYVYPHLSQLQMLNEKEFYQKFIQEDFSQYFQGYQREIFCDYLEQLNEEKKLPFIYQKSGEWVGKVGTIDLVAGDEAGNILVGSCNWHSGTMKYDDFEWLQMCMKQAKIKSAAIYLYSKDGFDRALLQLAEEQKDICLLSDLSRK